MSSMGRATYKTPVRFQPRFCEAKGKFYFWLFLQNSVTAG